MLREEVVTEREKNRLLTAWIKENIGPNLEKVLSLSLPLSSSHDLLVPGALILFRLYQVKEMQAQQAVELRRDVGESSLKTLASLQSVRTSLSLSSALSLSLSLSLCPSLYLLSRSS